MTTNIDSEVLACFNEDGDQIKPCTRKEVHRQPLNFWHAVTNIWVINSQGEILCTKRSNKNEGNPNKWQTYVGGHVKYNDSFEETATRELDEELGLAPNDGRLVFLKREKQEPWKHITIMYALFWDGKANNMDMKDGEIDDAKWMSFDEYNSEKDSHPDQWCNNISLETYQELLKLNI